MIGMLHLIDLLIRQFRAWKDMIANIIDCLQLVGLKQKKSKQDVSDLYVQKRVLKCKAVM